MSPDGMEVSQWSQYQGGQDFRAGYKRKEVEKHSSSYNWEGVGS